MRPKNEKKGGGAPLRHFWCLVAPLLNAPKKREKRRGCPSAPLLVFSGTAFECAQKTRKKAGVPLCFVFEAESHRQKNMQKHGKIGFSRPLGGSLVRNAQPLRKLLRGRARNLLAQRSRNAVEQLGFSMTHIKGSKRAMISRALSTSASPSRRRRGRVVSARLYSVQTGLAQTTSKCPENVV